MKYILLIIFIILKSNADPITPLPLSIKTDPQKVALGKELFFDPILSHDGTIACVSCHDLSNGGDDGKSFSDGINNQKGNINSPTVFNALFNFRQFWDGRAKDLQDQAAGPIENPVEMGNSFENLIKTLSKTPYKEKFDKIYKNGITKESITDAIAEFEKTLITADSPFDRYLKGDKKALNTKEKKGYALFKSKGCIACHHGINIGGNMYNKFGIVKDIKDKNLGRYNITKDEKDKHVFKVPSLRNITKTAPYFHNGSVKNLTDAVKFMSNFQLGKPINEEEISQIVSFLKSLNGKMPKSISEK